MSTFLSKIMDSAQDVRVSDSNERLNEYIQGVLRKSDLESFVAVAPRRDGYRIYVGEDMENPFAYVDVYLDGEALVVEGSSKRHLSDAEMGDLARFLGINGKEAGEKLNRFRKFVDLLRSESGKSVDDLKDAKVSDSGNKSWPEEYREKLHAVPVPEKRGRLTEQEEQDIMDRRNGIAVSSVTQLLNSMGYDAKGEEMDITVRGNEKSAEIRVGGLHNSDGFLAINVEGGRTEYFDITDAESWINYLRTALGGFVKDSAEGGRYKVWVDSESEEELPDGFKEYYNDLNSAYNAAVDFVHEYDGKAFRVIAHVEDLETDETIETVENDIDDVEDSDGIVSDDEMLDMLRADASPKTLSRVANILKAQQRTSLKDGNTEVMAIAEYPNGALVYSFKQKAWQEAVNDSCKKVKDSDDESYKEELRTIYESYEDGSIMGAELEEELERFVDDNDVPSDMVSEIYERIDEFTIARKHASRDGGRTPDGRDEFHSWFESFYSKVCDSKEVKDSDDADAEGVTEESLNEAIRKAGEETKTDLTEEEKQSGDYPKGVVEVQGMSIAIENPKGSTRSGVDADGNEWSTEMQDTYGYFEGTAGADTDDIDVFVGEHPLSDKVFIVDQVKEGGSFDEHKVMFGYESSEDAREAYLRNYEDGWQGLGSITQVGVEDFRRWVEADKTRDKAFTEYIKVQDSMGKCDKKHGQKVQDDDHFRDAKGTTIMLEDRVRVLNPTTNNTDFIGDFGIVEGLDDDGYIHVQLDNIDRPLMFDSREVVVINRKVGDSETMRIFGKDYKKGDTLVDSDGVKARIMYRDGNDAVVLTEEDNKWYRLPIQDSKGDGFVAFRDFIETSLKRRGLDKYVDVDAKGKKGTLIAHIGTKKNPDAYAYVGLGENGTSLSLGWHTKPNLEFEDKEVSAVASMLSVDDKEAKRILKKFLKWVEWLVSMDGKDVIKKVSDAMDPNEDKDENIHVNWKISDLEKYLRKPASMRRGKKVEDSESIDKKALGEWLVGAADRAINSFGDGTVYYKDLGDGHSIVLDWIEGYDKDENNPFVKDGYGLEASLRKTKSSYFVSDWEYAYDDSSMSLEGSDKEDNGERVIDYLMSFKEEKVEDSKELPRRDFVFPADSTMVNDGKGHFPLNSLNRGRAALAFVARYDKLPKWYSGDMSLEEFKDHVRSEVKKAYPSIEVSDSAESGSGSFDFNEVYHDLDVALQKTRQYLVGKESESMTDADWDIATVGSAISRAMRYLHEAARKQGQTTDYTNVKDDCKVYDAKESTEDMWARICEADEITEREINLLNRRLNAEGRDTLDYDLMKNRYDLALTDEQERKALAWLNNQWKTSTGKERKNNPFGYREEQILENATDVTFVQFHNAGNRYADYFIPVYRVYSNDGSFEYYVQGGEVNIVG